VGDQQIQRTIEDPGQVAARLGVGKERLGVA
jgi:hypothetical protein